MKKLFALCLLVALSACKKDVEAELPAPEKAERARPTGQTITKEADANKEVIEHEQSQTIKCVYSISDLPSPLCSPPAVPIDSVVKQPKACPFVTTNLKTQSFTIDASKGGTLIGKDGTKLAIPANTFIDSNGKPVDGKVTVNLKEALSMTNIVLGGLTTTSDGKILESGGMIYVEATANGEQLEIAPSKEIIVTLPAVDRLEGMKIFEGQAAKDQTVNWINPTDIIAGEQIEETARVSVGDSLIRFVSFDIMQPIKPVEYKGAGNDLIEVNIEYPQFFPELSFYQGLQWRLVDQKSYTEGDVERDWVKVDIARSKRKDVYVLTFTDAKKKKRSYEVTPVFEGEDYEKALADYASYEKERQEREQREAARQRTLEKAREYADEYMFPMRQLGWVNCDRFYNRSGGGKAIVRVMVEDADNAYVYMVFTKRNICLPGYPDGAGGFVFDNGSGPMTLPIGEQVLIMAVTDSEGEKRFGMKKAAIAEELTVTLQLTETTPEEMRELLNANLKPKL